MSDEPKLEEQAIAQMVETQLSNQIKAVDEIAVEVHTDLLQAVQGEVESTSIKGKGLVVQEGIRLKEIEVHTDRVGVHPISLLFGQIKLKQPMDSTVRVVLTEADLNHAANSDLFMQNLPDLMLEVQGKPVRLTLQSPVTLRLPTDDRLQVEGHVLLHQNECEAVLCFKVTMAPRLHEQLLLDEFCCTSGQAISLDLAIALLQWINEQIKVPYIQLSGVDCQVTDLQIRSGQLEMTAEAQVRHMPDGSD
ncbi:DUF2993 domain-containing protein [Oscillatoria sp. FACHB-1407]|uniref:LmeA family phospholipid-binding protein n=1 Tax=Oscillatoria sp. FACHB-1407 TaxID=2692847 RepID=UPI001687B977|nr:DUF2993 domain-containing protein [Oscillatoria sp. FACHB-1407]MBD2460936.1 DUF2993 domain-containing protein [Oscillatoria sp. FACHB-1407]